MVRNLDFDLHFSRSLSHRSVSPVEQVDIIARMAAKERAARSVTARAFAVLDSFDAKHRRQSLTSISRRTDLPLTTVHRLVHELEKSSALVRGSDGGYEIGSKIWRLGILASVHAELREVALPYMEDVYELGNVAVQIAVLDGLRCLVVERIAGSVSYTHLTLPTNREV